MPENVRPAAAFPCYELVWSQTDIEHRNTLMMQPDQQSPIVMIVDDEQQVLDDVSTVLSASGLDCRLCSSAELAVEKAKTIRPDLIVSDINLHGHSGLEMIERIKQDDSMRDVPVMFLSGAQIPDIIRRSHAVGGSYYLRKPFDPEVLTELVHKALWMPSMAIHKAETMAREAIAQ